MACVGDLAACFPETQITAIGALTRPLAAKNTSPTASWSQALRGFQGQAFSADCPAQAGTAAAAERYTAPCASGSLKCDLTASSAAARAYDATGTAKEHLPQDVEIPAITSKATFVSAAEGPMVKPFIHSEQASAVPLTGAATQTRHRVSMPEDVAVMAGNDGQCIAATGNTASKEAGIEAAALPEGEEHQRRRTRQQRARTGTRAKKDRHDRGNVRSLGATDKQEAKPQLQEEGTRSDEAGDQTATAPAGTAPPLPIGDAKAIDGEDALPKPVQTKRRSPRLPQSKSSASPDSPHNAAKLSAGSKGTLLSPVMPVMTGRMGDSSRPINQARNAQALPRAKRMRGASEVSLGQPHSMPEIAVSSPSRGAAEAAEVMQTLAKDCLERPQVGSLAMSCFSLQTA